MKVAGFFTGGAVLLASTPVYAGLGQKAMMVAFQPLISAVQGMAYPVGFLGMCTGSIMMMLGQRSKGLDLIKWSALGYLILQLVPGMMGMVAEVGQAMRTGQ